MAEHIEREELRKYILEDVELCGEPDASLRPIAYGTILGLKGALNYVNTLPTADVVEVVRCKDCAFSREMDKYEKQLYFDTCVGCTKYSESYHSLIMDGDDFCSYGIKKEGAEE